MIPRDPSKPLIYIHIPKTAGTAMQALVRRNVPEDQVRFLGAPGPEAGRVRSFRRRWGAEVHRLENSGFEDKRAPKVLFGHMSFGLHRAFPAGAQYLSMVRHPVARVVSHYRFVKRSPNHHLHDLVRRKALSLADYVDGTAAQVLNNGQVRCLFGDAHRQIGFGDCGREMLEQALSHIDEHFVFVGVQELFEYSVSRLCRALGWAEVELEPRNVSADAPQHVGDAVAARILEYNSLDMALYEQIRRRLEPDPASPRANAPTDGQAV